MSTLAWEHLFHYVNQLALHGYTKLDLVTIRPPGYRIWIFVLLKVSPTPFQTDQQQTKRGCISQSVTYPNCWVFYHTYSCLRFKVVRAEASFLVFYQHVTPKCANFPWCFRLKTICAFVSFSCYTPPLPKPTGIPSFSNTEKMYLEFKVLRLSLKFYIKRTAENRREICWRWPRNHGVKQRDIIVIHKQRKVGINCYFFSLLNNYIFIETFFSI